MRILCYPAAALAELRMGRGNKGLGGGGGGARGRFRSIPAEGGGGSSVLKEFSCYRIVEKLLF